MIQRRPAIGPLPSSGFVPGAFIGPVPGGDVRWTPAEITTGAWYDPSDTDTISDSGGKVYQLDDIGTSGLQHMVQASGASQPTTGTRTLGSNNILDFQGIDFLEKTLFQVSPSGNNSVYMVAEIDSVASANASIWSMNNLNDYQFKANTTPGFNGNVNVAGIGSSVSLTDPPHNGPSIYNLNFDFSGLGAYNAFIDGIQRAPDTSYIVKLDASQHFRLFSHRGGTLSPDGAMGEVVVCEACDTTTRQLIEGYLAWKWDSLSGEVAGALVGNLEVGHPYKSTWPVV